MTRLLALILAVAALGLVAAGCGGDDDDEDGGNGAATTPTEEPAPADTGAAETEEEDGGAAAGGGGTVELSAPADGSLEFNTTEVSADAGEVTIEFTNDSADVPHNVTLEDPEAATDTVTGTTTSVTTDLEPGEYTFFCSVGNHRQAGMEGTLTVE